MIACTVKELEPLQYNENIVITKSLFKCTYYFIVHVIIIRFISKTKIRLFDFSDGELT